MHDLLSLWLDLKIYIALSSRKFVPRLRSMKKGVLNHGKRDFREKQPILFSFKSNQLTVLNDAVDNISPHFASLGLIPIWVRFSLKQSQHVVWWWFRSWGRWNVLWRVVWFSTCLESVNSRAGNGNVYQNVEEGKHEE